MSPNTQKVYAYAVADFARFHGQSPGPDARHSVRSWHDTEAHRACNDCIR